MKKLCPDSYEFGTYILGLPWQSQGYIYMFLCPGAWCVYNTKFELYVVNSAWWTWFSSGYFLWGLNKLVQELMGVLEDGDRHLGCAPSSRQSDALCSVSVHFPSTVSLSKDTLGCAGFASIFVLRFGIKNNSGLLIFYLADSLLDQMLAKCSPVT